MLTLRQRTLIVTPTYNERTNLEPFLSAVRKAAPEADVLVVDDASPDGTGQLADSLAREDPHVRVLHRAGRLGLGTAYVEGFDRGLQGDYGWFFQMDADLSHDPALLPRFAAALEGGADVVLGSRNIPGGHVDGWGAGRHLLSKGGSLYARLILGLPVRDATTGFRAFTRRALESINLGEIRSNGYSFQIETAYRALGAGLRLAEVPIVFTDRRVGESKLDRSVVVEAVAVVWRLRFESLLKRLRHGD